MKILKIILIILVVIFGGFAIWMATLDGKYEVSRSIYIDASPEIVYAEVSDFKTWPTWSAWFEKDSTMKAEFGDPSQGVGATYSWTSKDQGSGDMIILEAVPNQTMKTQINFGGMGSSNGFWTFTPKDGGTEVTWGFSGEMPFFFRFAAMGMDASVGPDFETGLSNLKTIIEGRKPQYTFTRVDLKPTDLYYTHHEMSISASMSDEFYGNTFSAIAEYLAEDMANVTGAPQNIYHYWNEEEDSTVFDIGIPCASNKPGNGTVMKGSTYAGPGIKLVSYGSYNGLKEAHEAMYEYFVANNLKMGDVVFEVYVVGPNQTEDESQWETEVYYSLVEGEIEM